MFGKKKKEDSTFDLDVPEFHTPEPQKPILRPEIPKFPNFEQEFGTIKREIGKPNMMPKMGIPIMKSVSPQVERVSIAGDKPIFVKIENYKEAMENIDRIKSLTSEADSLLEQIHKIRADEDKELESWQRDLDKVKEKLLLVDKKLFEL